MGNCSNWMSGKCCFLFNNNNNIELTKLDTRAWCWHSLKLATVQLCNPRSRARVLRADKDYRRAGNPFMVRFLQHFFQQYLIVLSHAPTIHNSNRTWNCSWEPEKDLLLKVFDLFHHTVCWFQNHFRGKIYNIYDRLYYLLLWALLHLHFPAYTSIHEPPGTE